MSGRKIRAVFCVLMTLLLSAPSVAAMAASKTVQILNVPADYVRVRSEPKQGDNVVTSLRKGSKVFYLGQSSSAKGWCKIRTDHGAIGYVYKDYLESYGAAKLSNIYYATGSTKVYKKASTSASRATTLSKYEHVIIYKVSGSWAYIQTLSGKGGYVKATTLKKAT